jgi:nicotinate (nicotinamide) nucleotide adenylyltransferase
VSAGEGAPVRRLGLLGGTFDPPHYGHLIAAQEAVEQLGLEQVLFMPAAQPPHKLDEPVTPLEMRVRMVQLAIVGNPCFALSLADAERPGPSYTADLLGDLQAEYGPETALYFIVGMDSLHDLPTWRDPARVLAQCILVGQPDPSARDAGGADLFDRPAQPSSQGPLDSVPDAGSGPGMYRAGRPLRGVEMELFWSSVR